MAVFTTDSIIAVYDTVVDNGTNSSVNSTSADCTNEYCVSDEDYLAMIEDYIFPSSPEWILITLHVTVFLVGLVGNALVCVSVYRNHTMRTVTNYFIVNLAVADFLVILICLPPTVLWDVTKTWFFGSITCKLVLYLQNVSVSVSVLTLTFISVDRWYAICQPLKFKSTAARAKTSILLIWLISMSIALPEAIVLDTRKHPLPVDTLYLTDCTHTWSEGSTRIYQLFLIMVLYVAPLTLMAFTYYQITRVLWNKNIPGSSESNHIPSRICNKLGPRQGAVRANNTSCEGQIRSRRKASKMLMAVVVMFTLCYLPVHLINVLRYTVGIPQTPVTTVASLVSHWLCYANSAVNPVIYNIMNGKFRKEFKNTFTCQCLKKNRRHISRGTTYLCKYTSTVSHCDKRIHELANFS
ncbi:orexin receptor type 2-like [Uloborus diversus]|uniref:orexin receptor type 2-like n=1 Tax=Uloborus diversus TaxID=327109 RepID=UPI002409D86A|nr:orexin receptor type 2-like [Uloborus diversus]